MVSILPIIKKNLILTKRSSIKSFLQLFYPTIFVAIFCLIDSFANSSTYNIPIQTYYDKTSNLSLNNNTYNQFIKSFDNKYYTINRSLAIIVTDQKVNKSITDFIKNISNTNTITIIIVFTYFLIT